MNKSSPQPKAAIVVWIIWIALMVALGVYSWVLKHAALPKPAGASPLDPHMPMILGGLAVFLAFMSLVARGLFLGRLKAGLIPLDSAVGTKMFITGHVICFAFSEAVGFFGLMLGFLGYPEDLYGKFMLGGLALLAWHIPLTNRVTPAS
jgi:hypothetical protein